MGFRGTRAFEQFLGLLLFGRAAERIPIVVCIRAFMMVPATHVPSILLTTVGSASNRKPRTIAVDARAIKGCAYVNSLHGNLKDNT